MSKTKAVRIVGYVKNEKLEAWDRIKKELETRSKQKLSDSYVLNFILSNIQKDENLLMN